MSKSIGAEQILTGMEESRQQFGQGVDRNARGALDDMGANMDKFDSRISLRVLAAFAGSLLMRDA